MNKRFTRFLATAGAAAVALTAFAAPASAINPEKMDEVIANLQPGEKISVVSSDLDPEEWSEYFSEGEVSMLEKGSVISFTIGKHENGAPYAMSSVASVR